MLKKILGYTAVGLILAFIIWYLFIAIKPIELPQEEIVASYQYPPADIETFELQELETNSYKLSFKSFDGSTVNGQITFPQSCTVKCPVLVGVSAMGRNYNRWWIDSWKGRETVTSVNKLGKAALQNNYILVAIDARYHGSRKNPDKTLRSIMNDLHFFGDKSSYEEMIIDTVKDYRVLLDWLSKHERIDTNNIVMAGYSMGGQVSLLTASIDPRIDRVVSIVPPYLDDKVALVAPKNMVSLIVKPQVLLITSDDDENASAEENLSLFNRISSTQKEHMVFEGNHILPANYVESVETWLLKTGLLSNPINTATSSIIGSGDLCAIETIEQIERTLTTGDSEGHGPDIGSSEWFSVVERRLRIEDAASIPKKGTKEWCEYVLTKI